MRVLVFIFALVLASGQVFAGELKDSKNCPPASQRRYGDAIVSQFVAAGEGLSFVCCVEDWPDIIGRDVTVKIARVGEIDDVGEDKSFYYEQLAIFLENTLSGADIRLCNICRDSESFAIVADVKADGRFIAPLLIDRKLARLETAPEPAKEVSPPSEEPAAAAKAEPPQKTAQQEHAAFVCSKNSDKFHKGGCTWAEKIKQENLVAFDTRQEAIAAGKEPCSKCKP